eukprot:1156154-Rhodomonas_salina.3
MPHHEQAVDRDVREPHHKCKLPPEHDLAPRHNEKVGEGDQNEHGALEAARRRVRGRVRREHAEGEQEHRDREGRPGDIDGIDWRTQHTLHHRVLQEHEQPEGNLPHDAVLDTVVAVCRVR